MSARAHTYTRTYTRAPGHIHTHILFVSTSNPSGYLDQYVERWTVNLVIRVRFPDSAVHFRCEWSWHLFYSNPLCTFTLSCIEIISFLRTWKQLVLANCLTACPCTMRTLINSMWPTAVIRIENYQHYNLLSVALIIIYFAKFDGNISPIKKRVKSEVSLQGNSHWCGQFANDI
jgi:hypothetical protein